MYIKKGGKISVRNCQSLWKGAPAAWWKPLKPLIYAVSEAQPFPYPLVACGVPASDNI